MAGRDRGGHRTMNPARRSWTTGAGAVALTLALTLAGAPVGGGAAAQAGATTRKGGPLYELAMGDSLGAGVGASVTL